MAEWISLIQLLNRCTSARPTSAFISIGFSRALGIIRAKEMKV